MRWHDVSLVLSQALYIVGVFIMTTLAVFADNAFRLQCKDFWVSGGDPNNNRLSFSWAFEFVSCIGTFISAAFIVWLVVLKARDDIWQFLNSLVNRDDFDRHLVVNIQEAQLPHILSQSIGRPHLYQILGHQRAIIEFIKATPTIVGEAFIFYLWTF